MLIEQPIRVLVSRKKFVLFQAGRYFFKRVFAFDVPVEPDAFDHSRAHFPEYPFGYLQVIVDLAGVVTDGQRF